MAEKTLLLGKEVVFMVGTIPVSCAEEISLDITSAELGTSCVGSGGIDTFRPGNKTIKGTVKGISKIVTSDVAASNFVIKDWVAGIMADTPLTIVFKGIEAGDPIYTMSAFSTAFKLTANFNDVSKYDASFRANTFVTTTVSI